MNTNPDRDILRQRIAEALEREDSLNCGYDHSFASRYGVDEETDGFVDAVMAVLPDPTDRAAVRALTQTERDMLRYALDRAEEQMLCVGDEFSEDDHDAIDSLRRLAAEEAPTQPEPHSCRNCLGVDPDTCLMNPNRPPEQCPRSEGDGYGLQCQKPAGHNLCTFEEQPAAGVRQDGAQPQEPPIVAYRSPGGHYLYCTRHTDELGTSWTPLLSDDLPDGGLCAQCGVDVLITQQGAEK